MAFMASAPAGDLTDRQRAALQTLVSDLGTIFGSRLHALVAYGFDIDGAANVRTLALVERVAFDDLARAAPLAAAWQRRGLAVPLLLSRHEFERTLDVFPANRSIIANRRHRQRQPVHGNVADADRRRVRAASQDLIHLREGFLSPGRLLAPRG